MNPCYFRCLRAFKYVRDPNPGSSFILTSVGRTMH